MSETERAATLDREPLFWAKVQPTGFCWEWTASRNGNGYGQFSTDQGTRGAHRVAYEYLVGPIPAGLTLDHLCRNRSCVNPDHLEPVSRGENALRGRGIEVCAQLKRARTHCKRGHEFTPENTRTSSSGHRECATCKRATNLACYHRTKGQAHVEA